MSEELHSDELFPPAPEIAASAAPKKRAAKKAVAKKAAATVKKAPAKKAAKKAVKTLADVVAEMQAQAAKPAPVEVAPEPAVEEPKAKVKRATKKAAKKAAPSAEEPASTAPPVEATPAPVEVPAPVAAPVMEQTAQPVAPIPVASAPEITPVNQAPAARPAAEPTAPTPRQDHSHGRPPQGAERQQPPPSPEGEGSGDGTGAPGGGRRLRWWERRKMERQARAAARAAAGGGGGGSSGGGSHSGNAPTAAAPSSHSARHEQSSDSDDDRQQASSFGPPEPSEGILELSAKGHGFIRLKEKGWAQLPNDTFVHADVIRKFGLRDGMYVVGEARKGPRGLQMTEVSSVNGRKPEELRNLPLFEELKAVNPAKRYQLETTQSRMTTRVIDMMTPIGRGQRGLIVAPPRAGKTTILQHIAEAITTNYPTIHLMILLVDERPEEVTEFKRVLPNAEIFASSNDQDTKSHARIAEMAINRAKRLVEQGDHVFMLMDSITRLARAYNNMNKNGATMSGGMGVGSMEVPRRLFAAARNTRTAGSLTILATALVETGSRMDDLIFQEFKGTGNMELVLDRKIAEQYVYPAVNIFKSGTRREELLLQGFQIEKIHFLRRGLAGHKPIEAIQRVISLEERYPSNAQMLLELSSKHAG